MSDQALNDAHVPGAGASPIDTHGTPTNPSTLADELRAGTSSVASHPAPIKITPHSPHDAASRGMPVVTSEPSGARVVAHKVGDAD